MQLLKQTFPMWRAATIVFPVIFMIMSCQAQTQRLTGTGRSIDQRVDSVLRLMNLEEKIGQLTLYTTDWESTGPTIRAGYTDDIRAGRCGALFNSHTVEFTTQLQKVAMEETRLKIPLLFGYDVIHGYKTIFPIPLGESSSWDLAIMEKTAAIAAAEAAASGLHWTFAPMVDIGRDPRWGRVMEGAGEDTWLGSRIAEARVRGFQGKGIGNTDAVLSCIKHYAAYGAPVAGRDYNSVDMSERAFREFYLPPYAAGIAAGAATVMTSFNDLDGIPATGSKWLMTDILRGELNFQGFVVTDYTAINEMTNHRVVADDKAAGELALQAGVDMDMQGAVFQRFLAQSLKEGKVSIQMIDQAVKRILRLKFELGLFDDPYKFSNAAREKATVFSAANRAVAREAVRGSLVLLKNQNNILPLSKTNGKIALIGPLADSKADMLGAWSGSGDAKDCVTLFEGIKNAVGASRVSYVEGCKVNGKDRSGFAAALQLASESDIVVLAIGESAEMSGEAAARADISLPGVQSELLQELVGAGHTVVVVLMSGRPLAIPEVDTSASAILAAWFGGTEAGNGIADVLFGDYNPAGKLTMSFPYSTGQIPVYYNEKSTGRPFDPESKWTSKYIDNPNAPLYPFGYGLSYTQFRISDPVVSKSSFKNSDTLTVTVRVTNIGQRAGTEVVQLYIQDKVSEVTRPVKELKGFERVMLEPGQTKDINIKLDKSHFSFFKRDMSFGTEPGEFLIMVGANSVDLKTTSVNLTD